MDNYYGQGYATSIHAPVGTLCTKQQKYPVTAIFMASYYSGGGQISATEAPCPALTTVPKRALSCQFLDQQFGKSKPASLNRPSPAIMTNSHYSVATASFIRAMMRPGVKGLVYPLDKPMKPCSQGIIFTWTHAVTPDAPITARTPQETRKPC